MIVIVAFIGYRKLTYTPAKPLPGVEAIVADARRPIWNPPPEQPLPDHGHGAFFFELETIFTANAAAPREAGWGPGTGAAERKGQFSVSLNDPSC